MDIGFSKTRKKQKAKSANLYGYLADVRNDFLHKLSTKISKNHAMIVIEDLQVINQRTSAAKNIFAAGHAVLACESNCIRSRKQEPVGMRN